MGTCIKTFIQPNGRIVIPSELRQKLKLNQNQEVFVSLVNEAIQIVPVQLALARAQALTQKYNQQKRSLSEALIESRSEENEKSE